MNTSMYALPVKKCLISTCEKIVNNREGKEKNEKTIRSLVSALIFLSVVHLTYLYLAGQTLSYMMTPVPLARSEQFLLSALMHYPDYMVVAMTAGVLVLMLINILVLAGREVAGGIFHFLMRRSGSPVNQEGTDD